MSPEEWRSHFPALKQTINGHPLAYLDTAATSQRPTEVVDAVVDFYRRDNANPGHTLHTLARRADADYENARRTAARFINAEDPLEVVFTRGTTEGVNLVATAWGGANLRRDDEVLLTVSEHTSNLLPWQLAAKRAGAIVRYVDIDDEGNLPSRSARPAANKAHQGVRLHARLERPWPNQSGESALRACAQYGRDGDDRRCAALKRLRSLPGLRILGPQTAADRISVFSFVLEGVAPQDIVASLDAKGIAIRGGDLASLPLLERLGVTRAVRASFYLYSTKEEVDRLVEGLSSTRNGP